jgi:hypothetical protein
MKTYLKISICIIAFLVIALIWLSLQSKHKSPVTETISSVQPASSEPKSTNFETHSVRSNQIVFSTIQPQSNIVTKSNPQTRVEMLRQSLEMKNVPTDFYGRVVDQDSNSLSGVKIKVNVRHWELTVNDLSRSISVERETDADGLFHIDGATGDVFDIDYIQKNGYELEPNTKPGYGVIGGSFSDPVIFKMWRSDIHEPLVTGKKSFQIIPDGRTYIIDLSKGTIAESGEGDLKIWAKRPAPIVFGQRYDWSCEIDTVNGGLLQETDVYSSMYLAPADGYTPSFKFEQKIGNGWGDSTGTKRFYVMLKNGQEYGRISIELFAYYNDHILGLIRIEYAINPSGSHILR